MCISFVLHYTSLCTQDMSELRQLRDTMMSLVMAEVGKLLLLTIMKCLITHSNHCLCSQSPTSEKQKSFIIKLTNPPPPKNAHVISRWSLISFYINYKTIEQLKGAQRQLVIQF